MSQMCVHVEFLAGAEVEKAILEAKQKAELWDVAYVKFDFNGASFAIGRHANVSDAVEEYMETHGKPYGICHA